ncbi:hypothetical protein ACJRO7_011053 [Eucalyptus globulus]|uniref:TIR domain-containing protein n=1 Tax=Eucalyptus globulus TaxID=34317 RepID=A0ABD3LEZ8_EUCGL
MEKGTSSRVSSGSSYEVFLSFRGIDTRYGFIDFLYHGMVRVGILVFRDSESLHVGEEIGELLQVIENSKIYIPIFSKNYASSDWCLRELAYMVECTSKSNGNKEILPIFLDVEPSNVKLKTNRYRRTLSKRQKTLCSEAESWERALIEVGNIIGWNWKKDESQADLIKSVIETVLHKLNVGCEKIVTKELVGVDNRVEAIIKMLDVGSDSIQFLGIHGMGGIGKTTLAMVIFNRLSSHFKGCHFLSDVRESSRRHGLVYLQKQLLSKFLDSRSILDQINDADDGIKMIKRVLGNTKVLIVLDDVDGKEQLKSLAEKGDWFGSGSRIIITTRDQSILRIEGEVTSEAVVEKSARVSTYEVCKMDFDDALKLFSKHAFRRDSPPDHYAVLSKEVVSTLGMLPLAHEVTGSSLNNEPKEFWEATLKKLKDAPPNEVQSKLMISYDKLDNEQKQVFLDIACFFVNKDKTYPFYMWDACGYHPHVAIRVLFLMSMIKIKEDNTFWMHDQVRDLGKAIVRLENKDPCKRSRVSNHKDALSILKRKEGSKIEALSIGFRELLHEDIILQDDELANLRNLRFFQAEKVPLVGDFNNLLPSLTWLSCHRCPFKVMAENFHPTNLIVLNLSRSNISEIGWIKAAKNLKVLDLIDCQKLRRIPDLSKLVSLEILLLQCCYGLIEIDPSIGELKLLTTLNLDGCYSIRELPEEIGRLQALKKIVMPSTLHELPKTFGNLESLLTLDLSKKRISKLPHSIGGMVKLTVLRLCDCNEIKELPYSIGKLQSLIELDLTSTGISHLPDSIGDLSQLKILKMHSMIRITKLPSAICLLKKLEELDASWCGNLAGEFLEEIERLSCLRILDLSGTHIFKLPSTVSHLSNLQELNLATSDIQQLPEISPSLTCLTWTPRVKLESFIPLPTSLSTLSQLKTLTLASLNVQFLPQLSSSLRELKLLNLAITQSPDFSNLKNLLALEFYDCSMPEFSGIFDAELETLTMERCTFTRLDAPFQLEMKKLTHLRLVMCEILLKVLDLSHMKNLQEVHLCDSKSLVEIRGLEELGSLSSFEVSCCILIERIPDLSKLRKLKRLKVGKCPELRSVEGLNHLESLKYMYIRECCSLESFANTSNLDLECCHIIHCGQLPRRTYCKRGMYCQCWW